jgi:hypothetical protein
MLDECVDSGCREECGNGAHHQSGIRRRDEEQLRDQTLKCREKREERHVGEDAAVLGGQGEVVSVFHDPDVPEGIPAGRQQGVRVLPVERGPYDEDGRTDRLRPYEDEDGVQTMRARGSRYG